jgi:peroxiredoxin
MTIRWMLPMLGLALAGLLVFAPSNAAEKGDMVSAELGKEVPNFALKDTFGKEFKLSEFKGKTIVLEWVNQGCPVSKGAHKKKIMQDTYAKYAGKEVIWLGIDTTAGAQPEKNRVYAAEMGIAFPILHDTDGKVGRMFGAKTTPHMFVIDKSGKLAYTGAIDDQGKTNYVAAALDDLLAGRTVGTPKTDPYGCSVKYPKD